MHKINRIIVIGENLVNLSDTFYKNVSDINDGFNETLLIDFNNGKVYYDNEYHFDEEQLYLDCGMYDIFTYGCIHNHHKQKFDISLSNRFKNMNLNLWKEFIETYHNDFIKTKKDKSSFGKEAFMNGVLLFGKSKTKQIIEKSNITVLDFVVRLQKEKSEVKQYIIEDLKKAISSYTWKKYFNILGENFPTASKFPLTAVGIIIWLSIENISILPDNMVQLPTDELLELVKDVQ